MTNNTHSTSINRRHLLNRWCLGFGGMAFNTMLAGLSSGNAPVKQPLAPHGGHFKARAKRIIFLFMHGGPSHVDLFDPKPELVRYAGQPVPESFGKVTGSEVLWFI